jgi:hypothetical protein
MSIITARRLIGGLGLAGALIASAPTGHADPGTDHGNAQFYYTVDLARVGITGTPYKEILVGETVCDNLAKGMPIVTAVRQFMGQTGATTDIATDIVVLAVVDLCPQFIPQGAVSAPLPSTQPVPVTIVRALT